MSDDDTVYIVRSQKLIDPLGQLQPDFVAHFLFATRASYSVREEALATGSILEKTPWFTATSIIW